VRISSDKLGCASKTLKEAFLTIQDSSLRRATTVVRRSSDKVGCALKTFKAALLTDSLFKTVDSPSSSQESIRLTMCDGSVGYFASDSRIAIFISNSSCEASNKARSGNSTSLASRACLMNLHSKRSHSFRLVSRLLRSSISADASLKQYMTSRWYVGPSISYGLSSIVLKNSSPFPSASSKPATKRQKTL